MTAPASYDVSCAAQMVMAITSDPVYTDHEARAALAVFGCLTGAAPDAVLRLAADLADAEVTAYPPPI